MSTLPYYLENLWRWKCNIPELGDYKLPDIVMLRKTQWANDFELAVRELLLSNVYEDWIDEFMTYSKNRLTMGAFRYGQFGKQKVKYNHLSSIPARYKKFYATNNLEYLVDIFNLYMAQWIDFGKDEKLIKFASAALRLYIDNRGNFNLHSIDDDNVHSSTL